LPCWQEVLDPLVDHKDCCVQRSRDYFLIDFNDFVEYATSSVALRSKISQFPNNHVVFVDSLPGTYDKGIMDSEYGCGFSIVGAAIGKSNNVCSLTLQIRYLDDRLYQLNEAFKEKKHPRLPANQFFPYEFFTLLLTEDSLGSDVEIIRYLTQPPILRPNEDYEYGGSLLTRDNELIESCRTADHARDSLFLKSNEHGSEFELARLLLYFPSYIDFMYDLVVTEKKVVGKRPCVSKRKSKKSRSLYKIIKSIRVRYEEEDALRKHTAHAKRTWVAPPYEYTVQGHWRYYSNPWWRGRGKDGNITLGRTWVTEHTKGEGQASKTEKRSETPQVQIKLKQTLSYARDVIKSSGMEQKLTNKTTRNVNGSIDNNPSIEWMHYERSKLTAGLRYMILKRDAFSCQLCGASTVEDGVKLEVDHIMPISHWGKTIEANLRTLCSKCNQGKSNKTA
jgi:5-methylcytosine-specific restriction endonuclease McrA